MSLVREDTNHGIGIEFHKTEISNFIYDDSNENK